MCNPKLDEQSYLEGERAALRSLLSEILRRLDVDAGDPQQTIALLTREREDAVAMLRSVCRDHGDNEWGPKLYLADVIDKHLARHLSAGPERDAWINRRVRTGDALGTLVEMSSANLAKIRLDTGAYVLAEVATLELVDEPTPTR